MKRLVDFCFTVLKNTASWNNGAKYFVMVWMFFTMGCVQFACYPFHPGKYLFVVSAGTSLAALLGWGIYPGFTYREETVRRIKGKRRLYAVQLLIAGFLFFAGSIGIYFL